MFQDIFPNVYWWIPCSSLQIRIEKAPYDANGVPISIEQIPKDQWMNSEFFVKAPLYGEGTYNNMLFPADMTLELEVMKFLRAHD